MRLFVYDMLVNVNVIYYVHVCEQARWAPSAGNSAIENLCIIIIIIIMWRSLTLFFFFFKFSPPGLQTLSRTTATASTCLTFLDDFRVFRRWLDILWNVYLADSLKAGTRSKRDQGQCRKVLPLALSPFTWKSFLRNDENKSDLFCFLSKEIERTQVSRKILVSTCCDSVVSSSTEVDLNNMSGCTYEEADTRVFLHATDCVKQGQKKILIRTADTDVVLYLQSLLLKKIKVEELWVALGTGKHFRYIAAHAIATSLGADNQELSLRFML